jgi:DNA-binding NtrC family response regulator
MIETSDKKSILVVDDDKGSRDYVARALGNGDYEVITARNGKEALSLFEGRRFDLIITDIIMPVMTGIDFLKRVRTVDLKIGVFIVSSEKKVDTYLETMTLGASEYLLKPVDLKKLRKTVTWFFSDMKSN